MLKASNMIVGVLVGFKVTVAMINLRPPHRH
jgi:hypothetical protein